VQLAALAAAGVQNEDLYVEKISAVNAKRPIFSLMMKVLERGDTLLLHSLSRVGRELPQILGILGELGSEGVNWRSLTEPHLDNSTSSGRLMLNITGAMAQFERDQIVDRTKRGMAERKRQGMWLGRKPKVSDADARRMVTMRGQNLTAEEIAARFPHLKIKASTVYARTNALMRAGSKTREQS
jgi:DNA invertase Pin-like site-specific DNA recombinase